MIAGFSLYVIRRQIQNQSSSTSQMHASGHFSPRLSTFSVTPILGGPRRSHASNFTTTSEIPVTDFEISDLRRLSFKTDEGFVFLHGVLTFGQILNIIENLSHRGMEAFMNPNRQNDKLTFLKFQFKLTPRNKFLIIFEQIFDIVDKTVLYQAIDKYNQHGRRVHKVA